ncbi:hypothetical protein BO70DRAFT_399625 [Aspergillus heteromorphus CBS 117.55]|uniref:Uncharacterized protein n=1 Tax=Aspergillus heteromorphus CBS 117.55 TaxID=1448321 RepID=A0A317VDN7_9EURO|nr:uncharacterized protein BO70DRAFT_399625 [Aspergillus heteromorphus CBS 117.55]PWY71012.1 hypothetical protein BO70DRAFT_399625 [Aspergillus heteromorphus CBS 117.55]
MDRLPREIMDIISGCSCDLSRESLQTLSLLSRDWNQVAQPYLFRHLVICPTISEKDLLEKIDQLLSYKTILAHVRQLSLITVPDDKARKTISFAPVHRYRDFFSGNQTMPRTFGYRGSWPPLVDLIRELPCLTEFNFLLRYRNPSELLEALRQYHPACRLSMSKSTTPLRKMPLEEELLSSPALHAIYLRYGENEKHRQYVEPPDRSLLKFTALAPHLKHVGVQIDGINGISDAYLDNPDPQEDLPEVLPARSPRASLDSLSFCIQTRLSTRQFADWHAATDFSQLKAWTIGCIEESTLPRAIAQISPFSQLEGLTLAIYPPTPDEDPGFFLALETMFASLPPLKHLCLLGQYSPSFLHALILNTHGQSLLGLKLHGNNQFSNYEHYRLNHKGSSGQLFSADSIAQIAARCPALQDLRIGIQRDRGSRTETALYTALAQFPSLRTLDLVLNCLPAVTSTNSPSPPRPLSDFEASPTHWRDIPVWHVRDCVINCAIDEDLATAIFSHILNNQSTRRLCEVRLNPLYGHYNQAYAHGEPTRLWKFRQGDLHRLLSWLGSPWLVERVPFVGVQAKRVSRSPWASFAPVEPRERMVGPASEESLGYEVIHGQR